MPPIRVREGRCECFDGRVGAICQRLVALRPHATAAVPSVRWRLTPTSGAHSQAAAAVWDMPAAWISSLGMCRSGVDVAVFNVISVCIITAGTSFNKPSNGFLIKKEPLEPISCGVGPPVKCGEALFTDSDGDKLITSDMPF